MRSANMKVAGAMQRQEMATVATIAEIRKIPALPATVVILVVVDVKATEDRRKKPRSKHFFAALVMILPAAAGSAADRTGYCKVPCSSNRVHSFRCHGLHEKTLRRSDPKRSLAESHHHRFAAVPAHSRLRKLRRTDILPHLRPESCCAERAL